jgi:CubicO group peptidase (beta-lactamase class C family)
VSAADRTKGSGTVPLLLRPLAAVRLAVACILLLSAPAARAQALDAATRARLDSVVDAYARAGAFTGVVAIGDHGRMVYQAVRGDADREWQVPLSPDAVFRIGSATKQFTAALVLTLVEEGRVRLDGRVADYLPDYPRPQGERITLHHLLTHTSGIPDYVGRDDFFRVSAPAPHTPADLIARFAGLPLEFEPGSRWSYSNSNYVLLGAIVERVTGESYAQALRARITGPLGLRDTGVDADSALLPRRVRAYFAEGGTVMNAPHVDASSAFGAGFLHATARDLLAWDAALAEGRPFRDPATAAKLVTPYVATGTPLGGYGYGWFIGPQTLGGRTVRVVQHGGTISGFVTGFWRIPEDHLAVVVLANTRAAETTGLVGALADALYGGHPALPSPPPR